MSNLIKAHIFGRRKRGDREEVRMTLFDANGNPLDTLGQPGPKGDKGDPGAGFASGPLAITAITAVGDDQDNNIFAVSGTFPDPNIGCYRIRLTASANGQNGDCGIMAFSQQLMLIKIDNTWMVPAAAGSITLEVIQYTNTGKTTEVGRVSRTYWYTWAPQVARYYNTRFHAAGTSIVIPKSQHGLNNYGSSTRAIHVQVQDYATGVVEIPQSIAVDSAGQVTITFAASVPQNSKLITLVGGNSG